jgi:hypothetical protein
MSAVLSAGLGDAAGVACCCLGSSFEHEIPTLAAARHSDARIRAAFSLAEIDVMVATQRANN